MEIIHIDAWGPFKVKSWSVYNRFRLSLMSIFKYSYIYFLKQKIEVVGYLNLYKNEVENEHGVKRKYLTIRRLNVIMENFMSIYKNEVLKEHFPVSSCRSRIVCLSNERKRLISRDVKVINNKTPTYIDFNM